MTSISNKPSFWHRVKIAFEILGYARAARELTRLGYHAEAKNCMMQVKSLRD
jgi:hypothetical protein